MLVWVFGELGAIQVRLMKKLEGSVVGPRRSNQNQQTMPATRMHAMLMTKLRRLSKRHVYNRCFFCVCRRPKECFPLFFYTCPLAPEISRHFGGCAVNISVEQPQAGTKLP